MKKFFSACATLLALSAPLTLPAAEHGGRGHAHTASDVAHEEVVDGVKATFRVMGMKEHMKAMGMELPKGVKETHHLAVEFKDVKTGKALTSGEVKAKVQQPDGKDQTKDLAGMQGHFGADFDLSQKGRYGIMCKFKLQDGKVRQAKFWYTGK